MIEPNAEREVDQSIGAESREGNSGMALRICVLIASLVVTSCVSVAPKPAVRAPGEQPADTTYSPAALFESSDPEQLADGASVADRSTAVTPERGLDAGRAPAPLSMPVARPQPGGPEKYALSFPAAAVSPDLMRLHILNVGAGSCHVVECPQSDDVIVLDCGQMSPSDKDLSTDEIAEYVGKIIRSDEPAIVLSHPDRDHINRIERVMQGRTPEVVMLGGRINDYRGTTAAFLDTVPKAKKRHRWKPHWHENGEPVLELSCGSAEVYMLTVNVGSSKNSQSLTIMIEYGSFKAVFTGDAEKQTEQSMMQNYGDRLSRATVLLASHHGAESEDSNHVEWAELVSPQVVVYSAGVSYGHPRKSVVNRYRASLETVASHPMWWSPNIEDERRFTTNFAEYSTHMNGTILIETDGDEYWLECSESPGCF